MSDSLYLATAKEVGGEARIGAALIAIAESVAKLVAEVRALREQAAPVDLATIEPVEFEVGTIEQMDPIGYVVVDKDDDIRSSEPTRRKAERLLADYNSNTGDADWAPYRLGVVYEAPSVTDEATGPRP